MEVLDLPQQLARFAGPLLREGGPDRPEHSIGPHERDIADLAVLDPFGQFFERP